MSDKFGDHFGPMNGRCVAPQARMQIVVGQRAPEPGLTSTGSREDRFRGIAIDDPHGDSSRMNGDCHVSSIRRSMAVGGEAFARGGTEQVEVGHVDMGVDAIRQTARAVEPDT